MNFIDFLTAYPAPIEPLLAEIFMTKLEEEIFTSSKPLVQRIMYWFRYVNDVSVSRVTLLMNFKPFSSFINSLYP